MPKYQFKQPARCDCGEPAVTIKNSSGVCADCLAKESYRSKREANRRREIGLGEFHVALNIGDLCNS